MVHFAQIAEGGTNGQIACDSTVPGLEMTAGLGGGDTHGTLDHEQFALVLTGEFDIEDGTGQTITAKAGDLVYAPTGSQVSARTSTPSRFLWSALRHVTGDTCASSVDVTDLESSSPPVVYLEDFTSMSLPVTPGKVNGAFFDLPGKDLSAGLYRLVAGNSVSYTYRYPEFKYIVEGEWHLTDGTGQVVHATAGDLLYFPMGTKVDFTVAETGLGYYIADARNANHSDPAYGLAAAMALNPSMVHFAQIAERGTNGQVIACDSKVPGLEMTAGLGGGDSHATQDHEEFALVLIGEFHIEDGTGQTITAKA